MLSPRLKLLFLGIFFIQQQVVAEIAPKTVFMPKVAGEIATLDSSLLPLPHSGNGPGSASSALFDSELDAVIAATELYNPRSILEDREYMGVILRRGDAYHYTVGPGEAGQDRITVRVLVPKDASIVAFWHTHGAEAHAREYFSEVDTQLVADWKLPFYLADHTGVLKVFEPGNQTLSLKMALAHGLPARRGFARGRIVSTETGKTVKVATGLTANNLLGRAEIK